mgnify:CR=1 FL=1
MKRRREWKLEETGGNWRGEMRSARETRQEERDERDEMILKLNRNARQHDEKKRKEKKKIVSEPASLCE